MKISMNWFRNWSIDGARVRQICSWHVDKNHEVKTRDGVKK